MNTRIRTCVTGSLLMALVSGCASNARTSAVPEREAPAPVAKQDRGPNPGADVAGACGSAAFGSLKAGVVGIPIGVGVLVVCMPLALLTAVAHEVLPAPSYDASGAPDFAYPGNPPSGTYVGGRGSSGFAYPGGFYGDCYGMRCGHWPTRK